MTKTFFWLILSIAGLNCSCDIFNGLSSTSDLIYYRGRVVGPDSLPISNASIYAENLDFALLDNAGRPIPGPMNSDASGSFRLELTSKTHPTSKPVQQWENGPLRIYIVSSNYLVYYDSLTDNQLKPLQQNSSGEWVLPTITLQKKQ